MIRQARREEQREIEKKILSDNKKKKKTSFCQNMLKIAEKIVIFGSV
jgi:hypothetical protein